MAQNIKQSIIKKWAVQYSLCCTSSRVWLTRPAISGASFWCAQQLVKAMFPRLHVVHPIAPNPVRQPLRQTAHGNALPAFSNGFIMVLQAAD